MCIQGHVKLLTMTRFSKRLHWFTKKSPRDSPRVRVSPTGQPHNFHGLWTRYNRLQIMDPSRTNIKAAL